MVETYLNPDLFVVGGGVSRMSEKFLPLIDIKTPIVPAKLRNQAGIVGAAYFASIHKD
jgi:polyphosphate glucokinase